MKTAILNGHVHETAAHELTEAELLVIAVEVATDGGGIGVIPVVDVFGLVHLWAQVPASTLQEVRTVAAFAARTDARLVWHGAVA